MKLIKIARGKETIVAEGSRKELNNRLKELRRSTRSGVSGRRIKYRVEYKLVD